MSKKVIAFVAEPFTEPTIWARKNLSIQLNPTAAGLTIEISMSDRRFTYALPHQLLTSKIVDDIRKFVAENGEETRSKPSPLARQRLEAQLTSFCGQLHSLMETPETVAARVKVSLDAAIPLPYRMTVSGDRSVYGCGRVVAVSPSDTQRRRIDDMETCFKEFVADTTIDESSQQRGTSILSPKKVIPVPFQEWIDHVGPLIEAENLTDAYSISQSIRFLMAGTQINPEGTAYNLSSRRADAGWTRELAQSMVLIQDSMAGQWAQVGQADWEPEIERFLKSTLGYPEATFEAFAEGHSADMPGFSDNPVPFLVKFVGPDWQARYDALTEPQKTLVQGLTYCLKAKFKEFILAFTGGAKGRWAEPLARPRYRGQCGMEYTSRADEAIRRSSAGEKPPTIFSEWVGQEIRNLRVRALTQALVGSRRAENSYSERVVREIESIPDIHRDAITAEISPDPNHSSIVQFLRAIGVEGLMTHFRDRLSCLSEAEEMEIARLIKNEGKDERYPLQTLKSNPLCIAEFLKEFGLIDALAIPDGSREQDEFVTQSLLTLTLLRPQDYYPCQDELTLDNETHVRAFDFVRKNLLMQLAELPGLSDENRTIIRQNAENGLKLKPDCWRGIKASESLIRYLVDQAKQGATKEGLLGLYYLSTLPSNKSILLKSPDVLDLFVRQGQTDSLNLRFFDNLADTPGSATILAAVPGMMDMVVARMKMIVDPSMMDYGLNLICQLASVPANVERLARVPRVLPEIIRRFESGNKGVEGFLRKLLEIPAVLNELVQDGQSGNIISLKALSHMSTLWFRYLSTSNLWDVPGIMDMVVAQIDKIIQLPQGPDLICLLALDPENGNGDRFACRPEVLPVIVRQSESGNIIALDILRDLSLNRRNHMLMAGIPELLQIISQHKVDSRDEYADTSRSTILSKLLRTQETYSLLAATPGLINTVAVRRMANVDELAALIKLAPSSTTVAQNPWAICILGSAVSGDEAYGFGDRVIKRTDALEARQRAIAAQETLNLLCQDSACRDELGRFTLVLPTHAMVKLDATDTLITIEDWERYRRPIWKTLNVYWPTIKTHPVILQLRNSLNTQLSEDEVRGVIQSAVHAAAGSGSLPELQSALILYLCHLGNKKSMDKYDAVLKAYQMYFPTGPNVGGGREQR
ncbi:hypothetical protein EBR96_00520 [bacterium]|nr:hypothetical protein [bacterium]